MLIRSEDYESQIFCAIMVDSKLGNPVRTLRWTTRAFMVPLSILGITCLKLTPVEDAPCLFFSYKKWHFQPCQRNNSEISKYSVIIKFVIPILASHSSAAVKTVGGSRLLVTSTCTSENHTPYAHLRHSWLLTSSSSDLAMDVNSSELWFAMPGLNDKFVIVTFPSNAFFTEKNHYNLAILKIIW